MFIVSLIIFILTLIAIIVKPYKKKIKNTEAFYAMIFALTAFLIGVVSYQDALFVINKVWNAGFSLISIMIISLILDEVGFFRWAALMIAYAGDGKGRNLFINTILLGSLISIFFNNDGTILILTPIVYEMCKELGFKRKVMLPFLLACGFIADTASVPLVVSNLTNIINADTLDISFEYYVKKMFIPGVVAIISVTLTMYLYFRKAIIKKYKLKKLIKPVEAVKDWKIFSLGFFVLLFVIVGYFIGARHNIPVSIISIAGAIIMLFYGSRRKAIKTVKILKKAPWSIIFFAFGMYIVVYGFYKNGFDLIMLNVITYIKQQGEVLAVVLSGLFSTVTSCTMNNLPSVMIGAFSVKSANIDYIYKEIISFSSIIGNDIGAKLTPLGSLATILWFYILKSRGIKISWKYYMKVAFFVIFPVLIISLLSLSLILIIF